MELHTFSSFEQWIPAAIEGSMNEADEAIVYYNPKTIAHKKPRSYFNWRSERRF